MKIYVFPLVYILTYTSILYTKGIHGFEAAFPLRVAYHRFMPLILKSKYQVVFFLNFLLKKFDFLSKYLKNIPLQ